MLDGHEIESALEALKSAKAHCEAELAVLLPGSLVKRVVKGHEYYYLVRRDRGKVSTEYKGKLSPDEVAWFADIKQRRDGYREKISKAAKAILALEDILQQRAAGDSEDREEDLFEGSSEAQGKDKAGATGPADRGAGAKAADPGARRPQIVRRARPLVLLNGDFPRGVCIRLAREWNWDLLDLEITENAIPKGMLPAGLVSVNVPTHPIVKQLLDAGCPAVRLGRGPHPQDHAMPAVLPDLGRIGRMAAEHLLARGFKTVGHIGWDPEDPESLLHSMYASFRQCALDRGASCHVHTLDQASVAPPAWRDLSRYEARTYGVAAWLSSLPKPVGVFCISDSYTASVCIMCRHHGIAVPEEVALVGMGNVEAVCEATFPTLSSVDSAKETRTRRAMQLLRGLMNGERNPKAPIIVPPAGVIERQSTDLLAVDDPDVAQALRFMWDHLEQNLSVDDVAEAAGVGRRSLERSFRGQLGRSVSAELQRKRLEHCCRLLKTTDLPIADIAPLSGFSSPGYFNKVFRNAFGTTPRKWRVAAT